MSPNDLCLPIFAPMFSSLLECAGSSDLLHINRMTNVMDVTSVNTLDKIITSILLADSVNSLSLAGFDEVNWHTGDGHIAKK